MSLILTLNTNIFLTDVYYLLAINKIKFMERDANM